MVHEEIGVDKITFLVNRLHLIEPMQQFLGLVFIPYISDAGSYYFMWALLLVAVPVCILYGIVCVARKKRSEDECIVLLSVSDRH